MGEKKAKRVNRNLRIPIELLAVSGREIDIDARASCWVGTWEHLQREEAEKHNDHNGDDRNNERGGAVAI